jgi:DNA modification methylase
MANDWLAAHKAELVRRNAAIDAIDLTKIDIDKRARAAEVEWAAIYVRNRPKLIEELDKLGIPEKDWCRALGPGFSYSQVLRRIQVLKGYPDYLRRRDEVGDDGCFGLKYAAFLARPEKPETPATSSPPGRPQNADGILGSDPDHQFICGKAHIELRKMLLGSVQVCVCSPPYWPARRIYNMLADGSIPLPTPDDIGFEPTFEGYLDHVVRRDFRALKCVLRPDGVLVVVLDDVIANPGSIYRQQTYHHARDQQKLSSQISFRTQDTTTMRPKGNWLGLPWMFAAAMMDDGWVWRDQVVWDKGALGRKESTENRCRHNFEYVLFFTKSASGYWYNQDALRIPLSGGMPYSMKRRYSGGRSKPDVLRKDGDRDFRVASNPLGRVADAVWHIPPSGGYGSHSASFPEELVRRVLLLTAPPSDLLPVATVIDIFGGSGSVPAVAKQMGLKSIYIDANPNYTAEAQQRVLSAKRDRDPDRDAANDNNPTKPVMTGEEPT